MSNAVSALEGMLYDGGIAQVRETGLQGMVTVHAGVFPVCGAVCL